jgi:hypothetical protein
MASRDPFRTTLKRALHRVFHVPLSFNGLGTHRHVDLGAQKQHRQRCGRRNRGSWWVPNANIAQHFGEIFDVNCRNAFKSPDEGFDECPVTRKTLGDGGFLEVERTDDEKV